MGARGESGGFRGRGPILCKSSEKKSVKKSEKAAKSEKKIGKIGFFY